MLGHSSPLLQDSVNACQTWTGEASVLGSSQPAHEATCQSRTSSERDGGAAGDPGGGAARAAGGAREREGRAGGLDVELAGDGVWGGGRHRRASFLVDLTLSSEFVDIAEIGARPPMSAPAVPSPTVTDLDALLRAVGEGAAERERDRDPTVRRGAPDRPTPGLGALRVPVADGGPGGSLRELFDVVIRLAEADPNVAQSLRAHFHFVEGRRAAADAGERDPLVPRGARRPPVRQRDGRAHDARPVRVRDDAHPAGGRRRVRAARDEVLLDGQPLRRPRGRRRGAARRRDGRRRGARRPRGRRARGRLGRDGPAAHRERDVALRRTSRSRDDEVLPSPINAGSSAPRGAFLQLYLVAVAAGVAGETAADAAALVATADAHVQPRVAAERPATTRCVQQVVGEIDAAAFAARVRRARRGRRARRRGGERAGPRRGARGGAAGGARAGRRLRAGPAGGRAAVRRRRRVGDRPRAQPRPPLAQRPHARLAQPGDVQGEGDRRPARSTASRCPRTASSRPEDPLILGKLYGVSTPRLARLG